jgi:hypothetical protein
MSQIDDERVVDELAQGVPSHWHVRHVTDAAMKFWTFQRLGGSKPPGK